MAVGGGKMGLKVCNTMGYLRNCQLGDYVASNRAIVVVWADAIVMAMERKGQTQGTFLR